MGVAFAIFLFTEMLSYRCLDQGHKVRLLFDVVF